MILKLLFLLYAYTGLAQTVSKILFFKTTLLSEHKPMDLVENLGYMY